MGVHVYVRMFGCSVCLGVSGSRSRSSVTEPEAKLADDPFYDFPGRPGYICDIPQHPVITEHPFLGPGVRGDGGWGLGVTGQLLPHSHHHVPVSPAPSRVPPLNVVAPGVSRVETPPVPMGTPGRHRVRLVTMWSTVGPPAPRRSHRVEEVDAPGSAPSESPTPSATRPPCVVETEESVPPRVETDTDSARVPGAAPP